MPPKSGKNKSTAVAEAGEWDKSVKANRQVWLYLFMDDEIVTSYSDSKDVTMKQMAWWNPSTTNDVRHIDAQKVAIAIHRFFNNDMELDYEEEFEDNSFNKAIMSLSKVLEKPDATVPDLAGCVNDIFVFGDES